MVTPEQIMEAAHLGRDLPELPFNTLVAMTTPKDWDGTLYRLKFETASQLAAALNATLPVERPTVKAQATVGRKRPVKALSAAAATG